MPIAQPDLEAILREGFPDAEIKVDDLAGDGDHYRARIVSSASACSSPPMRPLSAA